MNKRFLFVLIIFFISANICYSGFWKCGWTIFRKVQSPKYFGVTIAAGVRGDLSGMFYNPAVLGTGSHREIFLMSELGFAGDKFLSLVYGEPLKNGMVAGGIVYYDAGEMELNWLEDGYLKTSNVTAQRDILGILSYGHRFKDNLFSGVTIKFASSKIAEKDSSLAFAGDLGGLYMPVKNLSISAAIQNLGSSSKFIEKKNPLPLSFYLGSGYFFKLDGYYLSPGVGFTYYFTDQKIIPDAGVELGYEFASINIGYRFNVDESNLHFGVGFVLKNIDFGYAYIPGFTLDSTHRLSIGYRFQRS